MKMDSLIRLTNNPMVSALTKVVTLLGTLLAGLAVWIFLDTRTTVNSTLDRISSNVDQVNIGVVTLKGQFALNTFKIDDLRERITDLNDRMKHVEQKDGK